MTVAGQEIEVTGRGFRLIERPSGERHVYWYATPRAVAGGYRPRQVRLHVDLDSVQSVQACFTRCNTLWDEMLKWMDGGKSDRRPVYVGTVESLVRCYQTDPESTFHDKRHNTQRGYESWCTALVNVAGKRRISALVGQDLRTWHKEVSKPKKRGGAPRERLAKAIIQMFRIVLQYGCEVGLPDCLKLAPQIEDMEFRKENIEKKIGKPKRTKKVRMTYEQAEAIVTYGLSTGKIRDRSAALAVAAQFEFTISQIDAIGHWIPSRHIDVTDGMVSRGGKVWVPGLRFEDFATGILDFSRSKTAHAAQFDVAEYPLFQLALSAVPEDQRKGPVVIDEDGFPPSYRVFYDMYQRVREGADVPKDVWNARARHGGGTEARASGASIEDTADHMQKSDIEGTRRDYIEGNVEITRRVARKRVASRAKKKGAA
ncbi:hypothetical protein [Afipia carboxidovorans]|uniref:hypothetical protein n=1 Tax=Afipia carboxidovorans TaxID=40137 RepID=UPI0030CC9776